MSRMIDLDPVVAEWIRDAGGSTRAIYLDAALERTRRVRQSQWWTSPSRWLPPSIADLRVAPKARTASVVLVLLALLVTLALALIQAGALRWLPPPYGAAGNGLIAFDQGGIIYLADADGGHPRPLSDGTSFDQQPTWSPDGTRLAYLQTRSVMGSLDTGMIAIADVEHGTRIQISVPDGGVAYRGIAWSPDSRSIAFAGDYQGWPSVIYVAAIDGSGVRRIDVPQTKQAWGPAWSPDGRLIAFTGMGVGDYAVWMVAPDGTGPRQITPAFATQIGPIAWSPDGTRLVYTTAVDASQPRSLRVVNPDGSEDHAITPVERVGDPAWSPDGRFLAFLRPAPEGAELVVARPDGTVEHVLFAGNSITNAPAWSPDGTKVLDYIEVNPGCGASIMPCDLRLIQVDIASGRTVTMPVLPGRSDAPSSYTGGASSWQRVTAP